MYKGLCYVRSFDMLLRDCVVANLVMYLWGKKYGQGFSCRFLRHVLVSVIKQVLNRLSDRGILAKMLL